MMKNIVIIRQAIIIRQAENFSRSIIAITDIGCYIKRAYSIIVLS